MKFSTTGKLFILVSFAIPLLAMPSQARYGEDSDINAYQRQLRDRIELGQQSGKLTASEQAHLKDYFRDIDNLESRYNRRGLSFSEKQSIWNELEQLDSRITAELNDRQNAGWIRNWNRNQGLSFWQRYNARRFDFNPFDTRVNDINARISTGIRNGRISSTEASFLNSEMKRLRAMLNGWKRSNGYLSRAEQDNYTRALDRLNDRLDDALRTRNTANRWNSGNWNRYNRQLSQNTSLKQPNWSVSRDGGYYDANGVVPGTVMGNQLYLYGGTMSDGRPVPNTPNVPMNAAGHIY